MPSKATSTYRRPEALVPVFLGTLMLAGCGDTTDPVGPGPDGPEYIEVRVVTVGPTLTKCYGVGLRTCMVVDGGLFYDGIEGFEYETRLYLSPFGSASTIHGTGVSRRRTPAGTHTVCWSSWRSHRLLPRR